MAFVPTRKYVAKKTGGTWTIARDGALTELVLTDAQAAADLAKAMNFAWETRAENDGFVN